MIDEELKIKALLAQGIRPRIISERDDIKAHYSTVVKYRNELREEASKANVAEVTAVDPVALQVVVDNLPKGDIDISNELQTVVAGVKGIDALDVKFHSAIAKLLVRAEEMIDDENLTATGLKTIGSTISEAYGTIHAKGTSITMNQNSVSADGLSAFKGVMR